MENSFIQTPDEYFISNSNDDVQIQNLNKAKITIIANSSSPNLTKKEAGTITNSLESLAHDTSENGEKINTEN